MKHINLIAMILMLIGAINWGLVGVFNYNLVTSLLGDGSMTVAVEDGRSHQVGQSRRLAGQFGERQADITLALMVREVHRHEHAITIASLPGEYHEIIPRPVAFPCSSGRHDCSLPV